MECTAWPCRQEPVSYSTCIEEPKYPRVLSALVDGNSPRMAKKSTASFSISYAANSITSNSAAACT